MTKFNRYILKILKEGLESQGSGGIARRASGMQQQSSTPNAIAKSGKVSSGVDMKFSRPGSGKMGQLNSVDDGNYDKELISAAIKKNDNDMIGTILGRKFTKDPLYFQSDDFVKSPDLQNWYKNPKNQQLVSDIMMNIGDYNSSNLNTKI